MRTCIIQTNNAPESLIRFTEIACLFNYENKWLNFFQDIIITDQADQYPGPSWKINAGQYITTGVRTKNKNTYDLDLRGSDQTINFSVDSWNDKKEMRQYRGMKQEYLHRNYMVMVLKSRSKMLYLSNNEKLSHLRGYQGPVWVPASGNMAGRFKHHNPDAQITIYDINPTQLKFSEWLNSNAHYPDKDTVDRFVSGIGKVSIAEQWKPCNDWSPAEAEYKCIDLIDQELRCPTLVSNILEYMPVYHAHGFRKIKSWKDANNKFIVR